MDLQYFDLPLLHSQSREGQAFIRALDLTTNMAVFGNKSVQRLITYQWKRWKVYYYAEIVVPYLVLMALYEYASHKIESFWESKAQVFVVLGAIFALSVYFLVQEVILLARSPRKHLSQLTSLFQAMPSILLITNSLVGLALHNHSGDLAHELNTVRVVRAVTSMFVWFKFFLLLRCMTLTAYLVQMIIQVFADIKAFLLILGITFIAFADAFYAISPAPNEESAREEGYLASLKYTFVVTIGMAEGDILDDNPIAFWCSSLQLCSI